MKSETLYLIDSHSLIFQVFHAIAAMSGPNGLPTNAVFGFTRDLFFLREKKPTYLLAVFDVSGPTFRDAVYADYKAHRSPMPDDLQLQIPMIHELLEAMRIPKLGQSGFEADDVIATLARKGEERGMDVFICSSDKDCRQLLSDHVKIFNLRKKEIFDRASLVKEWGITPEQVVDYQTLVGDSVDNVPGVPGIGPKTASQLLQKYGTLDNLVAHVEEIPGKKKESVKEALPRLETSRKLVRLDTNVPMEIDWDAWRLRDVDAARLYDLFRSWGFRVFADQMRAALPATSLRESPAPPPTTNRPTAVQGDLFAGLVDDGGSSSAIAAHAAATTWQHDYHLVNTAEEFDAFLAQLEKQSRVAIDLETTHLDPHLTSIVGIAVCWTEGQAHYLALQAPAGEPVLDTADTLARLKPLLESPALAKVNQNIKYEWQVFHAHGIRFAGIAGDSMIADYLLHAGERTHNLDLLAEKHLHHRPIPIDDLIGKGKNQLSMAQVPAAKVAQYACEDADIAFRLCAKLEPLLEQLGFKRGTDFGVRSTECGAPVSHGANSQFNIRTPNFLYDDLEIPLVEVLADMEMRGIRLDRALLGRMSKQMEADLARLEADIYELAGRPFNIQSVKQLREILFDEKGYKPTRRTMITRTASTDQETLEQLASQGHELPKKLLEHRKIAKLKSTYVDALPALVNPKTQRVHASFNQTVAATGRLSSSEPNLQNIPIRSELGGQIRQAFLPAEGWTLVTADYSQIELRLLAHFAEDEVLLKAFESGHDIHTLVASQVFGVGEKDVTADMRRMAKTVNFGVIYGISAFGLAQRLEMTKEEAGGFIDAYFQKYPRVLAYQDLLLQTCRRQGYVSTILGRRRAISGIRPRTTYKSRNQPEREAINMQIQGSAADLIKVAMVNLHRRFQRDKIRAKLLLQIHDELIFESPPDETNLVLRTVRDEMTGALADQLKVPLAVEVGTGPNWLDVE
jgi:DNA polymerase-1